MTNRDGRQGLLFEELRSAPREPTPLKGELQRFSRQGSRTRYRTTTVAGDGPGRFVDTFVNEFWTSRQRAAHSLHEVSYRACFKPQLPRFFLDRLTATGDVVYDPFMGRGTTPIEAALRGRRPVGCDVNPLSRILVQPRFEPPTEAEVEARLAELDLSGSGDLPEDLLVFYHPETLREICALRGYFLQREGDGSLDSIDTWIRMVAIGRLTGHSPGFFSVYTMPPNQAVSVAAQRKINERRHQVPPRRVVPELILRKTRSLLRDVTEKDRATLQRAADSALMLTEDAASTSAIDDGSVKLVVTSPPFLDVVQYSQDNWMRCWFAGIDADSVAITMARTPKAWQSAMTEVFEELARVLVPGGYVAFEVGEVRKGTLQLEELVVPCGVSAGLQPELILINDQEFTKTANCWGVTNNSLGTNTNRVVLFRG